MRKPIKLVREYRGVVIFRKTTYDHRLPWTTATGLAADTLAGIKELIRERSK